MEEASGSNEKGENSKSDAKNSCGSNSSARGRDKKLSRKNSDISCKSKRSVKRKLKPFSLGKWQKSLNKEKAKKQTFNLDRELCRSSSSIVSESSVENVTCICTGYRKTKTIPERNIVSEVTIPDPSVEDLASASSSSLSENFTNSGLSECNKDVAEATYQDLPNRQSDSNNQSAEAVQPIIPNINEINITELTLALRNHLCMQENLLMHNRFAFQYSDVSLAYRPSRICRLNYFGPAHTQVDYIHHLVPGLQEITNCSFYWGKMDRYKAEKQLDKKPEGTFLLRDSAQEEYLFSVSFRRYGRTLHARIEQLNHKFSFDSHDPNVFAASTVCGLLEHYKNPRCCMFFEPMLTLPVHRKSPFDLQHLCRSVISDCITYDNISQLKLPKQIKSYLKEYHYKEKVRVRHLENDV